MHLDPEQYKISYYYKEFLEDIYINILKKKKTYNQKKNKKNKIRKIFLPKKIFYPKYVKKRNNENPKKNIGPEQNKFIHRKFGIKKK